MEVVFIVPIKSSEGELFFCEYLLGEDSFLADHS